MGYIDDDLGIWSCRCFLTRQNAIFLWLFSALFSGFFLQDIRDDDPLIHRIFLSFDLLIVLVSLARKDDDIAPLAVVNRILDGLPAVRDRNVLSVRLLHAGHNVGDK